MPKINDKPQIIRDAEVKKAGMLYDVLIASGGWKRLTDEMMEHRKLTQTALNEGKFEKMEQVTNLQGVIEGLQWPYKFVTGELQRRNEIVQRESDKRAKDKQGRSNK